MKRNTLYTGQTLHQGEQLTAQNSDCKAMLLRNGNLNVYINGSQKWSSNTAGKGVGPYHLTMQQNGHLVLADSKNKTLWGYGSKYGAGQKILVMQDGGNLSTWANGNRRWGTGTRK